MNTLSYELVVWPLQSSHFFMNHFSVYASIKMCKAHFRGISRVTSFYVILCFIVWCRTQDKINCVASKPLGNHKMWLWHVQGIYKRRYGHVVYSLPNQWWTFLLINNKSLMSYSPWCIEYNLNSLADSRCLASRNCSHMGHISDWKALNPNDYGWDLHCQYSGHGMVQQDYSRFYY
jgi:hypothetical protein